MVLRTAHPSVWPLECPGRRLPRASLPVYVVLLGYPSTEGERAQMRNDGRGRMDGYPIEGHTTKSREELGRQGDQWLCGGAVRIHRLCERDTEELQCRHCALQEYCKCRLQMPWHRGAIQLADAQDVRRYHRSELRDAVRAFWLGELHVDREGFRAGQTCV